MEILLCSILSWKKTNAVKWIYIERWDSLLRHNAQMRHIYTSKKLCRKHKFPIKNDNSLDKV